MICVVQTNRPDDTGPVRLNYAKIIPYIEYFTDKISHLISEDSGGDAPEQKPSEKTE